MEDSAAARPSGYTERQLMRIARKVATVIAGLVLASASGAACVAHDNTNFPTPPPPGDAASPARIVVDSGLVIFSEDDGGANPDIGGVGEITPDARALPDSSPDVATPDLAGLGSSCDVFAQKCGAGQGCYPSADGTGTCLPAGQLLVPAQCTGSSSTPLCQPGLTCDPTFHCATLCHMDQPVTGCEGSITPLCQKLGTSNKVGFCSD
jgi:hypothetical protein